MNPRARFLAACLALAVLGSAAGAAEEDPAGPRRPPEVPAAPGDGKPRALAYGLGFAYATSDIVGGEMELSAVGGFSFGSGSFLVEADGAVLRFDPEAAREEGGVLGDFTRSAEAKRKDPRPAPPAPPLLPGTGPGRSVPPELRRLLGPVLRGLYAEGNVRFTMGEKTLRTTRLYVDFQRGILATGEVVMSMGLGIASLQKKLPLILRAASLRRVAEDTLLLEDASYSTCDFPDPNYQFRCTTFTITDHGDFQEFSASNNVLRVEKIPVLWLPILGGRSDLDPRPLRTASYKASSRFGSEILLTWADEILVGGERWGEWRLHTDWRSKRGFGVGPEVKYDSGPYEGELLTWYQADRQHTDSFDDSPVPREDRGRVKWEHRHRFSKDLRLDLLLNDFSDRNFQREYLKQESLNEQDPESYAHLRWQRGNDQATLTGKLRTDDFETETEELPSAAFRRLGVPAPWAANPGGILDSVTWSFDATGGAYARERDDALGMPSDRVTREDVSGRIEGTKWVGPVALVPFAVAGATSWQGQEGPDGDDTRGDLAAGLRARVEARRTFATGRNELFDLRDLRHVSGLEVLAYDRFAVTRDPRGSRSVDDLDVLDEVKVGGVRWRNRLQTRRGAGWVDWIDLELRALYFPDGLEGRNSPLLFREEGLDGSRHADFTGEAKYRAHAPAGSAGPWEGDLRVRLRENLYLLGEAEYEPDVHRMLTTAQGIRWFSVPTLSLYLGRRTIARDSDIWTAIADWFVSERWGIHFEQQVDTRDDGGLLTEIGIRRVWHDFVLEVFFENDRTTGDVSLGINFLPTALWEPPTSAEKLGKLDFDAQRWYR